MGLLDFIDEVDDFAFSNFDSASPASTLATPEEKIDYFTSSAFPCTSMESISTT